MYRRPIIGIATQTQHAVPGQSPLAWVMGQRYVRVLTTEGAIPWLIPLLTEDESTLRHIYDRLDGIFLTGGVDVDPTHYGEGPHEQCGQTDIDRDWSEIKMIQWAREDRKPVLGVCRGLQVMNVAVGGTLYQDLHSQHPEPIKHDYFPTVCGTYQRHSLVHHIGVSADTRLGWILESDQTDVNSMHHQGVRDLSPVLTPSAFAPDGLIEAAEIELGQFFIGVQWHPEELTDKHPGMHKLFQEFLDESARFGDTEHKSRIIMP